MSVPVFAVERRLALTYFFLGKDPNPDYLRQSWGRALTLPERRQSGCTLKMQAGELPMRSAAKRSNIVPSAELIGNIRAGAFVPPGLQLDQQSVVSFPRSMNNPG
jgi:hypothetical protein